MFEYPTTDASRNATLYAHEARAQAFRDAWTWLSRRKA